MDASRGEVIFEDGFYQEVISLFGAVAAEGAFVGHFVYGLVHGFDADGRQRPGHVADAQADDVLFGVSDFECVDFLGDVREQVAARQFQEVFVYECHIFIICF